jgi:predicted RNA binding protein YcfA (HicA-like mRNA interferase family)
MGFSQKASCKAQGFLKRSSKKNKGKYIISPKYKKRKSKRRSRSKRKSKSYDGAASWDSMLRKFMNENGFDFVRKSGGHYIWRDGNGITITASSSPTKSQYKNVLKEIGRDIKREKDALKK